MRPRKGRQLSFRVRMLVIIAALASGGLAAAGGLTFLIELDRTDARIDASLTRSVSELRNFAEPDSAQGSSMSSVAGVVFGAVRNSVNASDECTLAITTKTQNWAFAGATEMCEQILRDHELVAAFQHYSSPNQPLQIRRMAASSGSYSFVSVPVKVGGDSDQGWYVVVRNRGGQLQEVVNIYLQGYLPVALVAVALIVVVGWILTGAVVRPLRSLVRAANEISGSQDLTRRVRVTGRDEVAQLATAFNRMFDSLEKSFSSQRQLIDDVGHELRTPLTIIQGQLEVAGDRADFQHARTLALDEVERMKDMVNSLTLLAQVGDPNFLNLEEVELVPLLDEIWDKARALGDRRWRTSVREEATALVDPKRITQAMLQLAANAVQYSSEGSQVTFGLQVVGSQIQLSLTDEGRGISEADQARIFTRFGRAEGISRAEGSGLGLAIVSAIVHAHGGRIAVTSSLGKGSTFTIILEQSAPAITQTVEEANDFDTAH